MIFGYTEAQIAGFFLTYGVGAFILFMIFIIGLKRAAIFEAAALR